MKDTEEKNGGIERQIRRLRKLLIFLLCLVLIGVLGAGACGYKLYKKVKSNQTTISTLQGDVDYLSQKLDQTTNYYEYDTAYRDDSYNWFAIGNSLTLIPEWGRGICSTKMDNDYYGLVKKGIEDKTGQDVVSYRMNYASWERATDRSKTLDLIDNYLNDKLNLVTIQLGENVPDGADLNTYEADLEKLIDYVKEKVPKAEIVVLGDWWSSDKNEMRKEAAENTGVKFADFSEVMNNKEFQSKAGTVCEMPDGSTTTVPEVAATHPGDKGMEYISKKVLEALGME